MSTVSFTPASETLFKALASDAVNWNGEPLLDGNVFTDKHLRGNITHLKKLGLIITFKEEGNTWVQFTDKGKEVAMTQFSIEV